MHQHARRDREAVALHQLAHHEAVSLRPGEHGLVVGVARGADPAGKVVDAGPGRDDAVVGAVVVAARVVRDPVHDLRVHSLGVQPGFHRDAVERQQLRIARRVLERNRERALAVLAAQRLEGRDAALEAPPVLDLGVAAALEGGDAVAP